MAVYKLNEQRKMSKDTIASIDKYVRDHGYTKEDFLYYFDEYLPLVASKRSNDQTFDIEIDRKVEDYWDRSTGMYGYQWQDAYDAYDAYKDYSNSNKEFTKLIKQHNIKIIDSWDRKTSDGAREDKFILRGYYEDLLNLFSSGAVSQWRGWGASKSDKWKYYDHKDPYEDDPREEVFKKAYLTPREYGAYYEGLLIKENYESDRFYEKLMQNGGKYLLPGENPKKKDARYVYLLKVNDENFKLNDSLKQQLIDEGKYDNSWICLLNRDVPLPMEENRLPIYGSSDGWVTRWFRKTPEEAFQDEISDEYCDAAIRITGKRPRGY